MKKTRIFVYGTLLDSNVRKDVCREKIKIEKNKVLEGYKKEGLNIIKDKGSSVSGGIIKVNEKQLNYLDAYEDAGTLYKMIDVVLEGEKVKAYQLI